MKKLFVYIPTYNRPQAIRAQLKALAPQASRYPENFRILINDNSSSSSNFNELAEEYQHIKNIEFRTNSGNIGANANIALGFVFSRPGEFLWILSDNDIVADGAVTTILEAINYEIDFFCFVDSTPEFAEVDLNWKNGCQKLMDWRLGLISDGLYNVNTIKSSIEDAFYFHNSSFPHLAVAFSALKKKGLAKIRLLNRKNINKDFFPSTENPTDYSLAQVCMPLLVALFEPDEARDFSNMWLRRHGVDMYKNRKSHYHLYLQSRASLKYFGGWEASYLLHLKWIEYVLDMLVVRHYLDIKRTLIQCAKKNLSKDMQEKMKKIRMVICGK
jgi:glycosyltransferase involved in cell wall biosynthesis